ncbi:hypothetical protein J6590_094839 [Homalodisca vitripennis]|nr:hypothetical protein J6590_094839 [Homalodisca vitripennis]
MFLSDRILLYYATEGQRRVFHHIWSSIVLLGLEMPDESHLVAALIAAMKVYSLSLAIKKREIVLFTKMRIPNVFHFKIRIGQLETKPAAKCLGSMCPFIRSCGLGQRLGETCLAKPALSPATRSPPGRISLLHGFRTSTDGVVSIYHLAMERQTFYRLKIELGRDTFAKEERTPSFNRWKRDWEAETDIADTAQHTECGRWHVRRASLSAENGFSVTPENIFGAMHQRDDTWNCHLQVVYVQSVLRAKKVDLDGP